MPPTATASGVREGTLATRPAPAAPAPARGETMLAPTPVGSSDRITIGEQVLLLERTETGGTLRLLAADGSQHLAIEITPAGPVLRLRAGLAIAVEGALSLVAEDLSLHASKHLSLSSDGALDIRAAGDLTSQAEAHTITARLGDVQLQANDDVVMRGERIKMNC